MMSGRTNEAERAVGLVVTQRRDRIEARARSDASCRERAGAHVGVRVEAHVLLAIERRDAVDVGLVVYAQEGVGRRRSRLAPLDGLAETSRFDAVNRGAISFRALRVTGRWSVIDDSVVGKDEDGHTLSMSGAHRGASGEPIGGH